MPRSGRCGGMAVVVKDNRVFAGGRGGVDGMPSLGGIVLLRGTLSGARAAVETR